MSRREPHCLGATTIYEDVSNHTSRSFRSLVARRLRVGLMLQGVEGNLATFVNNGPALREFLEHRAKAGGERCSNSTGFPSEV